MNKKEMEDMKWGRYEPEVTAIPEDEMNEMLGILNNVNNRKGDVVNWDEKARMNESSAKHGHLIQSEDSNVFSEATGDQGPGAPKKEKKSKRIDEVTVPVSDEEKDLMDSLGGIMDAWEDMDGS